MSFIMYVFDLFTQISHGCFTGIRSDLRKHECYGHFGETDQSPTKKGTEYELQVFITFRMRMLK